MLRITALIAFTTLAASTPPADARCAMQHQRPKVLTASVAVPVDGGGVVVGTESVPYNVPDQGEALQKSWGFLTGRDLGEPVITVLAPGLVVYGVQPNMRTTGELTDGTKVIAKLTLTKDKVAKLAAPKVKVITHRQTRDRRWISSTTVVLHGTAPSDAIAMILYDDKDKPRSWRVVKSGAASVEVFGSGRCQVLPNGTEVSKLADKVTVAWVDKYGRLSARSKSVTIIGR